VAAPISDSWSPYRSCCGVKMSVKLLEKLPLLPEERCNALVYRCRRPCDAHVVALGVTPMMRNADALLVGRCGLELLQVGESVAVAVRISVPSVKRVEAVLFRIRGMPSPSASKAESSCSDVRSRCRYSSRSTTTVLITSLSTMSARH